MSLTCGMKMMTLETRLTQTNMELNWSTIQWTTQRNSSTRNCCKLIHSRWEVNLNISGDKLARVYCMQYVWSLQWVLFQQASWCFILRWVDWLQRDYYFLHYFIALFHYLLRRGRVQWSIFTSYLECHHQHTGLQLSAGTWSCTPSPLLSVSSSSSCLRLRPMSPPQTLDLSYSWWFCMVGPPCRWCIPSATSSPFLALPLSLSLVSTCS